MQSLDLNTSNHNEQQEKCGEQQKIGLKRRSRKDGGLMSLGDTGHFGGLSCVTRGAPGRVPCRGTQVQLASITAPLGCSQQHKEGLAGAPGEDFTVAMR